GKQMLITRWALTTFSIASNLGKYLAILPVLLWATYPGLERLNFLHLHSANRAVLAILICTALSIILLLPPALRGVEYRPSGAPTLARRKILSYGFWGLVAPFPAIWLVDRLLAALHLA